MLRRSSSLVTIFLDEVSMDGATEQSHNTSTVIEIENYVKLESGDEFPKIENGEFQGVINNGSENEQSVEVMANNPSTASDRVKYWFHNCKNGCNCSFAWARICDLFEKSKKYIRDRLHKNCDKSYWETYFLYANMCGVSPFRFDKENKPVIWLKKIPYYPEKYTKAIQTINITYFGKRLHIVVRFLEAILICSVSLSIVLITGHRKLFQLGFEKYVVYNAETIHSLFCFTDICQPMEDSSDLNVWIIAAGVIGWAKLLAGSLVDQLARDCILFSAMTLGKAANHFQFKETRRHTLDIDSVGVEIHNQYQALKKMSKHINAACNITFRFFLLSNIFMFAVFMDEYFNPDLGKVIKAVRLTNVVFVCLTFYFANLAAKTGDRFRDWIKKYKNRRILGMSQMEVVIEAVSPLSLGMGRGALFIYDAFLLGFTSVAATYFYGIVETRPK